MSADFATVLAQQRLAFHGPVRLASWSESSSQEFRVKLELLDGREALEHFERATRRTKKRAGQRYRATWQSEAGEVVEGAPSEVWFLGADWSHQNGATIKFAVDEQDWIRAQRTVDVDANAPRWFIGLVQLDTDDKPINQAKAALVEWAEGLVGGPKSKAAARRCQESEFQAFVGQRLGLKKSATQDQADRWIKQQVGIHTKKLLDYADPTTQEPYWERYERRVQSPFITWTQSRAARVAPACTHPGLIKAGQRNNTNDYCPDCGWFPSAEREPGSDDEGDDHG
jgi:hypothetical protein